MHNLIKTLCWIFFCCYLPTAFAENWSKPYLFDSGLYPNVVMDQQGNAINTWNSIGNGSVLRSMKLIRNGSWTTASAIAPNHEGINPSLTIDAQSNATILFAEFSTDKLYLKTARLAAGSTHWQVYPYPLGSMDHLLLSQIYVASDAAGNAVAAWEDSGKLQAARYYANGTWIRLEDMPIPSTQHTYMHLAVGANGLAAVVWEDEKCHVYAATLQPFATAWGKPTCLAARSYNGFQKVAIDPSNNVVVIWKSMGDGSDLRGAIKAARLAANSSQWENIGSPGRGVWGEAIDLTVNGNGEFQAIWSNSKDGHGIKTYVQTARLPRNSKKWNKAATLMAVDHINQTRVTLDEKGDVVAVWTGIVGLYASTQPAGGTWRPVIHLANNTNTVTKPAISPLGTVEIAWEDYENRFDVHAVIGYNVF